MNAPPAASAVHVGRVFEASLLLLVSVAFATVALAGRVEPVFFGVFAAALVFRLLVTFGVVRVKFPRRLASALALLYVGYYCWEVFGDGGSALGRFIPATMRMLFFFTALKLVIAQTGRDYLYLGLLAFLHMLMASMFAGSVIYLGFLAVFLVLAILAYTSFEIVKGYTSGAPVAEDFGGLKTRRMGRRLTLLAALLSVGVLMLSVGLFLILPRTPGFSSLRGLAGDFRVGFADEIDLGATGGTLALDTSPVMHVRSLNDGSLDNLRWRGLGLTYFSGTRWSNPNQTTSSMEPGTEIAALVGERRRAPKGKAIDYSVTMQPLSVKAVFLAGLTDKIVIESGAIRRLEVDDTDSLLVDSADLQPLRYQAHGWVSDRDSFEPAPVVELFTQDFQDKYLQLPEVDPRVPALAGQIIGSRRLPFEKAKAIEQYLLQRYGYSLELPAEKVDDPLAHFLFERGQGHCEYFASAMAVMLRGQGIPARIAAGFYGGVYNPLTGLQVVRAGDAHSWVEAYIERYGWLTFDPTPPVSAVAGGWMTFWLVWDALESSWTDWVLDYDVKSQLELAHVVQTKTRAAAWNFVSVSAKIASWLEDVEAMTSGLPVSPGNLPWVLMAAVLGAGALLWLAWVWLRPWLILWYRARRLQTGRAAANDCSYLYERALEILRRQGFRRDDWQTAEEFARSIDSALVRGRWEEVARLYNAARFGGDADAARRLPGLVMSLQRAR
jgi:hypothetical protein